MTVNPAQSNTPAIESGHNVKAAPAGASTPEPRSLTPLGGAVQEPSKSTFVHALDMERTRRDRRARLLAQMVRAEISDACAEDSRDAWRSAAALGESLIAVLATLRATVADDVIYRPVEEAVLDVLEARFDDEEVFG